MTLIESGKIETHKTPQEVFDFLANCNNHQQLMPQQVVNWQSTATNCSFTISGTADLSLQIKELNAPATIILEPYNKIPFPFTVTWKINPANNGSTVEVVLEADMNMFIKMVAAKPLENFLHYQVQELSKLFNG